MKPFARMILVSSLALAAGCISIERTGEYYVATKTMTFQKLDEYHCEKGDSRHMPLPFSIGIPDRDRGGETYLPPSAGVILFFAGFLPEDAWPITSLVFAPAGAIVWTGEALALAPIWDTICLPVDFYRRDEYLKKTSDNIETKESK